MPPPFSIYSPKDRMRVTALDGNTLTVDRGQWNSTPGAAIRQRLGRVIEISPQRRHDQQQSRA